MVCEVLGRSGERETQFMRESVHAPCVRIAEFEDWLGRNGKSPAEQSLKVRLRSILAPKTENQ